MTDSTSDSLPTPRRLLLKGLGVAGLTGLVPSTAGASDETAEQDVRTGRNKSAFELTEATIADVHAAMERDELTAQGLIQGYLDRIEEYDTELNAILRVNPNALARAGELDQALDDSGFVGPLHGIPVVLKDNYDTGDMPTTAGSKTLETSIPQDDAFLVTRLREAGGIVVAKANLHEFAAGYETLSSLGGQTHNPYDTTRVPGGSSGGTAAALAANLGMIGTGTDTAGSVRVPPAFTNMVGIRPTMGLTSRDGIIPLAKTNDTGGPITRTVTDAAIMLDVMVGYDPADPETARAIGNTPVDDDPPITTSSDRAQTSASNDPVSYTDSLQEGGLRGARIGEVSDLFRPSPEEREGPSRTESEAVEAVIDTAIDDLENEGATVVEADVPLPNIDGCMISEATAVFEFKRDMSAYLAGLDTDEVPETVTDIINAPDGAVVDDIIGDLELANQIPVEALDGVGQFDDDEEPDSVTVLGDEVTNVALDYLNHLVKRDHFYVAGPQTGEKPTPGLEQSILATMADEDLDALMYPTVADIPVEIGEQQESPENVNQQPIENINCSLSVNTGLPAITVPAGFTADPELPVGMELLGRAFDEPTLLKLAFAYEQATGHRRPPEGFD